MLWLFQIQCVVFHWTEHCQENSWPSGTLSAIVAFVGAESLLAFRFKYIQQVLASPCLTHDGYYLE